ncbi:MAG: hypothetical protein AAGF31_00800 [Planctomycetota bacterium]
MSDDRQDSRTDKLYDSQEELRAGWAVEQRKLDNVIAFLRSELGYQSESKGNVNRHALETHAQVQEHDRILRGEGDKPGLIGWNQLFRNSWWMGVSAILTLAGYILGSTFPLGN